MKKILLLIPENSYSNSILAFEKYSEIIEKTYVYKRYNFIGKLLRKLWYTFNLPFKYIWYADWKKKINDFSIIIVFDAIRGIDCLSYLQQKNKYIIFWYWNKIRDITLHEKIQKIVNEIWSYNKTDCIKYGLKLNSQFYYALTDVSQTTLEFDFLFLGRDKGRGIILLELISNLINYKLDITIIQDKTTLKNMKNSLNKKYFKSCEISYQEYLLKLANTKVLIDIVDKEESVGGFSLRVLEALFYKKKLITNNTEIIHTPWYNKNNCFILGIDSYHIINDFLKTVYEDVEKEYIDFYLPDNWLKRICNL